MQETAAAPAESPASTAPVSLKSRFDEALALQQQKNWDAALSAYRTALDQSPAEMSPSQAAVIYYNMSTVAYNQGDLLHAYTWAKKSLYLNPGSPVVRDSYRHYSSQFQVPSVPRQISNYENFKSSLSIVPLDILLSLSVILILTAVALALRNSIAVRKNRLAGIFSGPPRWPIYLLAVLGLGVVTLSWIRYQGSQVTPAVVLTAAAPVQTAPGENMSVIFQAPAGLELEVLKKTQGYVQVRHPGAFSGWMKASDVEIMSLSFQQKPL